jgi:membrane associated rhomboid family serine protease
MERYAYCNFAVIAVTCWISFLGFRDSGFEGDYIFLAGGHLGAATILPAHHLRVSASERYHLAMNMVSLYFFGPLHRIDYGPVQFLIIYLAAMVGGGLLALYVHRFHDYRALGASGGVSGIILAHIFLFPGGSIGMMFVPIGIPSWLFAVAFCWLRFTACNAR